MFILDVLVDVLVDDHVDVNVDVHADKNDQFILTCAHSDVALALHYIKSIGDTIITIMMPNVEDYCMYVDIQNAQPSRHNPDLSVVASFPCLPACLALCFFPPRGVIFS